MEFLKIFFGILLTNAACVAIISFMFRLNSKHRKKQGKSPSSEIEPTLIVTSIFGPLMICFFAFIGIVELGILIYRKFNLFKLKDAMLGFAKANDTPQEREQDRWELELEIKVLKSELLKVNKQLAEYMLIHGDKP